MKTIFSRIIDREIPAAIIYEDADHIAFLDIQPFEKGHTLVVPKKEYSTIFDMPENEYLELQKIVLKIAKHYESLLGCGINIIQNNKEIAGQTVFHVHFHIIPRLEKNGFVFFEKYQTYDSGEMDTMKKKLQIETHIL